MRGGQIPQPGTSPVELQEKMIMTIEYDDADVSLVRHIRILTARSCSR